MTTRKIIPIHKLGTGRQAQSVEAHLRLERAGFMRMMAIGEPQLSEFVEKFKAKGYETEVVPFDDEETETGTDSSGDTCLAGDGKNNPNYGTIYVRKP